MNAVRIVDKLLESEEHPDPDPADIVQRSVGLLPRNSYDGSWVVRFPDSKFPHAVLTVSLDLDDDHADVLLQNRDGSHGSWERQVMFRDVSPAKFAKFIRYFAHTSIPNIMAGKAGDDWYQLEHQLDVFLIAGLGSDIYMRGGKGKWERV